jgi:hypothetical protein
MIFDIFIIYEKNLLIAFHFSINFFSTCKNKEKYYGEWMMILNEPNNTAEKIIITKDSIFIGAYPFHKFHSESLKLNGNKLELLKKNFKLKMENDSLLYFNNSTYIKKGYPFYNITYDPKKLISIDFPKLQNIKTIVENKKTKYDHVLFGKKVGSDEFALQLNDRISEFKELRPFLMDSHNFHDIFHAISLTADKNSKMKDINHIFYFAKSLNRLKVKLINDVSYSENNNMILTSEEGVFIRLSPFTANKLEQKTSDRIKVKLPPPPLPTLKAIVSGNNYDIISLVKNELFFGLKKISTHDLAELINVNYSINNYFIVSYDDESTYEYFLELIYTLNNIFLEMRNVKALKIYGKSINALTREEKRIILNKMPRNTINGISLEDFKSLNIAFPGLDSLN